MNDIPASDYGALRAFAAVAKASSFSGAARALGVSASSLSQLVQGLEDRLGARLLNRTTRSVHLTDSGAEFLARVRPALDELGVAFADVRAKRGRLEGVLRVHAFPVAAETHIAPILPAFHREHPGIVLDLTIDDEVVDLVASGFDAAFRVDEVVEREVVAIPLGPELRQIAVASPTYLAEHGTPETPRDLLDHRCIRWRWRGQVAPYAWEFCEDGRWFSVSVDGPLIADHRAFCTAAAVAGVGIAFAVEQVVAPLIDRGALVPLLERWSAPFPGFFLCHPRQRLMTPVLRAFVDAVTRTAPRAASVHGLEP